MPTTTEGAFRTPSDRTLQNKTGCPRTGQPARAIIDYGAAENVSAMTFRNSICPLLPAAQFQFLTFPFGKQFDNRRLIFDRQAANMPFPAAACRDIAFFARCEGTAVNHRQAPGNAVEKQTHGGIGLTWLWWPIESGEGSLGFGEKRVFAILGIRQLENRGWNFRSGTARWCRGTFLLRSRSVLNRRTGQR